MWLWELTLDPEGREGRAGEVEWAFEHEVSRLPAWVELVVEAVEPLDLEEGVGEVKQSAELLKSYAIDGVPTVVVQGKYKTGPAYTNSIPGTAQVLDYLVKQVQDKKL